jgi:hypothetical protein
MRYLTLASFHHYNPDWEMVLHSPASRCAAKSWKSQELDDGDYRGEDHTPKIEKLNVTRREWEPPLPNLTGAHACDLFEWQLLGTEGGFYSDMDILYVKSAEEFYQAHKDADVLLSLEANDDLAIGFLAADSNCSLFQATYQEALKSYRPEAYQCAGTEALYRTAKVWPVDLKNDRTTSFRTLEKLRLFYPTLDIQRIPNATVYPYYWRNANMLYEKEVTLPPETIGAHWFGGLKSSQERNRMWNDQNFRRFSCTFVKYAGMIP